MKCEIKECANRAEGIVLLKDKRTWVCLECKTRLKLSPAPRVKGGFTIKSGV